MYTNINLCVNPIERRTFLERIAVLISFTAFSRFKWISRFHHVLLPRHFSAPFEIAMHFEFGSSALQRWHIHFLFHLYFSNVINNLWGFISISLNKAPALSVCVVRLHGEIQECDIWPKELNKQKVKWIKRKKAREKRNKRKKTRMKKRQRIVENVPKGWALLSGALWTKRIASQVVAHNGFITHNYAGKGKGKWREGTLGYHSCIFDLMLSNSGRLLCQIHSKLTTKRINFASFNAIPFMHFPTFSTSKNERSRAQAYLVIFHI